MTDFKDWRVDASPPWMQGPLGTAWSYAHGLLEDAYLLAAKQAVKARFPELAPPDALDAIGATLQIERAFAKDDTAYVAMLMDAWATWQEAGTPAGMTRVLTTAGLSGVTLHESWAWSDGNPSYFFTVVCTAPTPWNTDPLADGQWQDAGTWNDGGMWAAGIPVADRRRLKALIDKWKPAHAVCGAVIVTLRGTVYGVNAGTFGGGGTYTANAAAMTINMTV